MIESSEVRCLLFGGEKSIILVGDLHRGAIISPTCFSLVEVLLSKFSCLRLSASYDCCDSALHISGLSPSSVEASAQKRSLNDLSVKNLYPFSAACRAPTAQTAVAAPATKTSGCITTVAVMTAAPKIEMLLVALTSDHVEESKSSFIKNCDKDSEEPSIITMEFFRINCESLSSPPEFSLSSSSSLHDDVTMLYKLCNFDVSLRSPSEGDLAIKQSSSETEEATNRISPESSTEVSSPWFLLVDTDPVCSS
mmetsp:Transcript_23583/g.35066  ORF Transcript_23583/g.35066 Transcript_23583/m.35066 type:complete len:252 (+) Transcript_23583:1076-1831(+)